MHVGNAGNTQDKAKWRSNIAVSQLSMLVINIGYKQIL